MVATLLKLQELKVFPGDGDIKKKLEMGGWKYKIKK